MPIQSCTEDGKSGFQWGNSGKCYTGPGAKRKAILQMVAIEHSQKANAELLLATLEELIESNAASEDINNLPDSDFAYIEPGGTKDESGKTKPRSLRHLPIHDAAHVRNALARLNQTSISAEAKKSALAKIKAKAKKFGIDVSE